MRKNLIAGLAFGITLAIGASSVFLSAVLLQLGAEFFLGEAPVFALHRLPVAALVTAWIVGSLFAGLILGWFMPYEGGFLRAVAICTLMAAPLVIAVRIAMEGLGGWTTEAVTQAGLRTGVIGLSAGIVLWAQWLGRRHRDRNGSDDSVTTGSHAFRIRWHS